MQFHRIFIPLHPFCRYDEGRKIALIKYDNMNNPSRIQFTNGNVTKYVYSATGEKLRTVHQTAVPNITVTMGTAHELTASELLYTDSTDYYCGGKLTVKNGRMDKYFFDGGYAQATVDEANNSDNFAFFHYNSDHLGNVREVIDEKGDVVQITNYYPFGTPYSAEDFATHNPDQQDRKYNGKEFDSTHGLNTSDYGARQYCSLFGRWDRMDPLCEKYYSVSPYAYCHNNPVMLTDPNGEDDYFDFYGNYLGTNKEETDYIYVTDDFNRLEDGRCVVGIDTRVALADADLSAKAYSNIFTSILDRMPDVDTSKLHNEKISVSKIADDPQDDDFFNDANNEIDFEHNRFATTSPDHSDAHITAYITSKSKNYYNTVSDVRNMLGVHEFIRHYQENMDDGYNLYQSLKEHHSTWDRTSDLYKKHVEYMIDYYKKR